MSDEDVDVQSLADLEDIEIIYSDEEYFENEGVEEASNDAEVGTIVPDMSVHTFTKHTKSVFTIDISPNSKLLVTGGEDDTAYVWDLDTKECLFECTGHKDSVTLACFSHNGEYVATGDMGGIVQVWHVQTKKLVWCNESDDLEWLQWHPMGNILVVGSHSGDIYIWQVPQGNCKVLSSHGTGTTCGKLLPDNKRLVAGYEDGQVKLWDMKSATCVWQLAQPCEAGITSVDVNSDGTLLAIAPTSQLLLLSDGRIVANLQTNAAKDVEAILINSELGVVVTGSLSGELCVWDLGKHILRHQARIECSVTVIRPGRDGQIFVGSTDGAVYICNVKEGSLVNTLTGHKNDILNISVSQNGNFIATSSDDCTVKLFHI